MNTNHKIKNLHLFILAGLSLGSVGCANKNVALRDAHVNYNNVASDPAIVRDAPVALHEAKQTLDKADQLSKDSSNNDEVTNMAYLVNKKIEVAKATANQQKDQAELSKTGERRNEVVLAARTREVDRANEQAAAANAKTKEAEDKAKEAESKITAAETQSQISQSELQSSAAREADLQRQLADLKAKETETGTQLTLRDMMFEIGKSDLTSGGARDVNKIAQIAKQHPNRKIVIEGHTDSMGTDAYNQELSERRAKTVEASLEDSGIPSDKLTIKGYGKSFPVASNKTSAGRQLNRRVVVTILHEGKQPSDIERKSGKM